MTFEKDTCNEWKSKFAEELPYKDKKLFLRQSVWTEILPIRVLD
jgi:hypothetical protein